MSASVHRWRQLRNRAARTIGRGRTTGPLVGPVSEEEPERLLIATLSIRIPKGMWTMAFSTAHPSTHLEVLNQSVVDPGVSVSDYWVSGGPPGVWAREIGSCSDVLKVDALAEVGLGSLVPGHVTGTRPSSICSAGWGCRCSFRCGSRPA